MNFKKISFVFIMCLTLVFVVNGYIRFDLEANDAESIIYSDDYEVRYSASYLLSDGQDIVFDYDDNDSDGSTVFSLKKLFY